MPVWGRSWGGKNLAVHFHCLRYKLRDAQFYPGWVHAVACTFAQVSCLTAYLGLEQEPYSCVQPSSTIYAHSANLHKGVGGLGAQVVPQHVQIPATFVDAGAWSIVTYFMQVLYLLRHAHQNHTVSCFFLLWHTPDVSNRMERYLYLP